MNRKVIRSTSRSSADCTDILLRDSKTTRLVFRPTLVDNPGDPAAAVHGTFLYQHKGAGGVWSDVQTIPLSGFKSGEGYKLELHASEILTLFRELAQLYKLHSKSGIPIGVTELVPIDSAVARLADLSGGEIQAYLSANSSIGADLLSGLLSWAMGLDDPTPVLSRLVSLGPQVLRSLNVAVGLENLKHALHTWRSNIDNADEEFWQQVLTEHAFVLQQVFAWPTMIVKGKAYVGGKSLLNTGGNLVDFLLKNRLTSNVALVEIKTPTTGLLLSRPYRDGVYNVSEDFGGAVMQVLNYRHSLQREFDSLARDLPAGLEAFEPRCAVIIGKVEDLRGVTARLRSLDLYRSYAPTVCVITFDELFEKTQHLVGVLESSS